jgi:hypothetical protein
VKSCWPGGPVSSREVRGRHLERMRPGDRKRPQFGPKRRSLGACDRKRSGPRNSSITAAPPIRETTCDRTAALSTFGARRSGGQDVLLFRTFFTLWPIAALVTFDNSWVYQL